MNAPANLNCNVRYLSEFLSTEEAEQVFNRLVEDYAIADCRIDVPTVESGRSDFGKLTLIDEELDVSGRFAPETLWGKTAIWPEALMPLRHRVEAETGREFRTCVCIYYPDGDSWVDFHSDPPFFGDTTILPSLSLGAERPFLLREKSTGLEHRWLLAPGSLLVMGEGCQDNYEHCLPQHPVCREPRINLTFRQYGYE